MTAPVPYLLFPGSAAEALEFYRDIFGGTLTTHTYEDFGRGDGPPDAIAHALLAGTVRLYGADAAADEDAVHMVGATFALLGVAEPVVLTEWFHALAEGGRVAEPLEARAWGAHDGQVIDRYGVRWLIGYED